MRGIAIAIAATLALVACQGQPVALLDDPDEILAAAATSTLAATSVHIDLSADGAVALDPLGTGAGAPVELEGTSAAADIDLQAGTTRATFSVPGLLGLAGEVIVVDAVYLKTTLTGPRYRMIASVDKPEDPLKGVADLLARTDLDPQKGADAPCAGGTCYTLTIRLEAADLSGVGGVSALPPGLPIPIPDLSEAGVDLTLLVEQATTRLSGISAQVDLGESGDMTLQATFTRWNESVQIGSPPPDQVDGVG